MRSLYFSFILVLFSLTFVSANVMIDGEDVEIEGVQIFLPTPGFNITTLVNHSNSTDNINSNIGAIGNFNSTQFSNIAGVLTIIVSYIESIIANTIPNIFDQELNTTSNVTFNNLTVGGNSTLAGIIFYENATHRFIQF